MSAQELQEILSDIATRYGVDLAALQAEAWQIRCQIPVSDLADSLEAIVSGATVDGRKTSPPYVEVLGNIERAAQALVAACQGLTPDVLSDISLVESDREILTSAQRHACKIATAANESRRVLEQLACLIPYLGNQLKPGKKKRGRPALSRPKSTAIARARRAWTSLGGKGDATYPWNPMKGCRELTQGGCFVVELVRACGLHIEPDDIRTKSKRRSIGGSSLPT